jgi:hypothetical protein
MEGPEPTLEEHKELSRGLPSYETQCPGFYLSESTTYIYLSGICPYCNSRFSRYVSPIIELVAKLFSLSTSVRYLKIKSWIGRSKLVYKVRGSSWGLAWNQEACQST